MPGIANSLNNPNLPSTLNSVVPGIPLKPIAENPSNENLARALTQVSNGPVREDIDAITVIDQPVREPSISVHSSNSAMPQMEVVSQSDASLRENKFCCIMSTLSGVSFGACMQIAQVPLAMAAPVSVLLGTGIGIVTTSVVQTHPNLC